MLTAKGNSLTLKATIMTFYDGLKKEWYHHFFKCFQLCTAVLVVSNHSNIDTNCGNTLLGTFTAKHIVKSEERRQSFSRG